MKKIILVLGIVCISYINMQAQDTIRLTWKGSTSEKTIEVMATAAGIITVDWGKGNPQSYTGSGGYKNVKLSYTYGDTNTYNVIIAVPKYTVLTHLYCGNNQLTALDVSKNTALTCLSCYSNQLTALDVSNNRALAILYCNNNQLTALDVSNNRSLFDLDCYSNQLTALDLSNSTALTSLECYKNQLTALDVSNNTALTYLSCYSNQLIALDVSNNTALKSLLCYSNQLTVLDVSNNTALTKLDCRYNQLPLSQLYPIWNNKVINTDKRLSPQNIYDTIEVSKTIDLSRELEFGSPAVPTQFTVTMQNGSSTEGNYIFENGELIFTASGDYKVIMQNDSVRTGTSVAGDEVTVTAYCHVWGIGANANLASLTVSEGTLTPAFAPTTTSYSVDVANSITNITLTAQAEDPKATVSGDTGTHSLQIGENPFTITVTAEDGVTTETYSVKVTRSSVGIEEIEAANSIAIYPNPSNGQLTIDNGQWIIEDIGIYDISGRTVETWHTASLQQQTVLDISHLSSGIYFIKVKTEEGKVVKKIIKK